MRDNTQTERGQAYTLEGFIGAMVVLMAVLFALQSVVIAPTTGGAVDRTVQAQMQQETQDALVVASDADVDDKDNLFEMVEDWYEDDERNISELEPDQQDPDENDTYSPARFNETALGDILYERFDESGQSYNVELRPESDDEDDEFLVYQGSPSSNAVTASYTVTLVDDGDFEDTIEVRVVVW